MMQVPWYAWVAIIGITAFLALIGILMSMGYG